MILKVTIVDDHQLFAEGVKLMTNELDNFKVIGIAKDGEELLRFINEGKKPDIVILDICMPKVDGLEVGRKLKLMLPECKIILCSMYYKPELKTKIEALNPDAILSKNTSAAEFEEALTCVAEGGNYRSEYSRSVEDCTENIHNEDVFYLVSKFTEREKELVELLKKGYSAKKIASILKISTNTVNNHKANIYQKLNINTVSQLLSIVIK
jgi:DNA-binding NarL/FixJ family response regulator